MKRALCLLRPQLAYRRGSFISGLTRAGFQMCEDIPSPVPGDVLLIWNRYSRFDAEAKRFEKAGATVLVAENAYIRDKLKGKWYALAKSHHVGAGEWRVGSSDRFLSWGMELAPFRTGGDELVILGQRGIGEVGIASPIGWAESVKRRIGGRIRAHPGDGLPNLPLVEDLAKASAVVTWASSAALVALTYGVPVVFAYPRWIGAQAGVPLAEYEMIMKNEPAALLGSLNRSDTDRLEMFTRLAWAQWRIDEIENGTAFKYLLDGV